MYGGPMGSASTYSGMGMLPPPNPSAPFAPPPPPAGSFTPKVWFGLKKSGKNVKKIKLEFHL